MDFDSFLTSPRWEILQILAEKPSSPVEIAEKLNTTVSYASQQLKLLDAAGIVVKRRTGAAKRGKPRALFSLSNELLYLTSLTRDFSEKKLIEITEHHKAVLKIWMLEDVSLHYYFEKLFWKLNEDLGELEGIFINKSKETPELIVVSDSKKLKSKIESFVKDFEKQISVSFVQKSQLKKFSKELLIPLHDPLNLKQKLKGGVM